MHRHASTTTTGNSLHESHTHAAFMQLYANPAHGRSRATPSRKLDSGHADTISTTDPVRRTNWNSMKPPIQCVLAH